MDSSRTPKKLIFYWILHLSRTPRIIVLSPPASTPRGFRPSLAYQTVYMPQKVKYKITSQLHACLHVSLLSPTNPLCSTTPLLPPPSFLLPFPLLLSYPLVAIAIAVAVAVLIALALLVALALLAAAVACYACACTS